MSNENLCLPERWSSFHVRSHIQSMIEQFLAPGPLSLRARVESLGRRCSPSLVQLLLDALVERVLQTGCAESAQAIAAFGYIALSALGLAFLKNQDPLAQARLAAVVEHLAPELDADQQIVLRNELNLWSRVAASPTAKLAVSDAMGKLEELMEDLVSSDPIVDLVES